MSGELLIVCNSSTISTQVSLKSSKSRSIEILLPPSQPSKTKVSSKWILPIHLFNLINYSRVHWNFKITCCKTIYKTVDVDILVSYKKRYKVHVPLLWWYNKIKVPPIPHNKAKPLHPPPHPTTLRNWFYPFRIDSPLDKYRVNAY